MKVLTAKVVFPIRERQMIYVHLESFDWDFELGREVVLVQTGAALATRQVGTGTENGEAILALRPLGDWDHALSVLAEMRSRNLPIRVQTA